jgi:RNA polymerase sigma-70 factor (ECF subfamily)
MKLRFPLRLKSSARESSAPVDYRDLTDKQRADLIDRMYHEHYQRLYQYALKLERSEEGANDLIQDTMLKAFKYLHSFIGGHELAWLKRVMKTCFIDRYQYQKKRRPISSGALEFDDRITQQLTTTDLNGELQERFKELLSVEGDDWVEAFRELVNDDLLHGLQSLSQDHREILIMSHLLDMPYDEIALEIERPLGTVMSRLSRARTGLGAAVAERSESLASRLASVSGQRRGTKRGTKSSAQADGEATSKTTAKTKTKKTTNRAQRAAASAQLANPSTTSGSGVTS